MRQVNEPRCLSEDVGSKQTQRLRARDANVEFKTAAIKSRKDYRMQQALQVITLRNIKIGEELVVD